MNTEKNKATALLTKKQIKAAQKRTVGYGKDFKVILACSGLGLSVGSSRQSKPLIGAFRVGVIDGDNTLEALWVDEMPSDLTPNDCIHYIVNQSRIFNGATVAINSTGLGFLVLKGVRHFIDTGSVKHIQLGRESKNNQRFNSIYSECFIKLGEAIKCGLAKIDNSKESAAQLGLMRYGVNKKGQLRVLPYSELIKDPNDTEQFSHAELYAVAMAATLE